MPAQASSPAAINTAINTATVSAAPLLTVNDLSVSFTTDRGIAHAVKNVTFNVAQGTTLGIVGESGSGKSVTAKSIMNLLPRSAHINGQITFDGRDVRALAASKEKHFWGVDVAMIFQDPMTSLNPVKKIGEQVAESMRYHLSYRKQQADAEVLNLLELVELPEPQRVRNQYPHELSGGKRQRAIIAMALACQPKLLIADEPTTALDVTIQRNLLELLRRLQVERGMAMILITHDLGIARQNTDNVAVMYAGRIVETADTKTLFADMRHPYTEGLLATIPRLADPVGHRLNPIPGRPPAATSHVQACDYAPRCSYAQSDCHTKIPIIDNIDDVRQVACFYPVGSNR